MAFYLLLLLIIFFIFLNNDYSFSVILLSLISSMSNIGVSLDDTPKNFSFIFLLLVIIGGSFFSTSSGIRIIKLLTLFKFSINNLISHVRPKNVFINRHLFSDSTYGNNEVNKYFLSIIIFIFSLFLLTSLLTFSDITMESSFKLAILTIMNTVNSPMYGLTDFNFEQLNILTKYYLIIFMIIGRVELLTLLIIFKKYLFKN